MYDKILSLLSEELLTQSEYIGGVLYLPAAGLLDEILSMVTPFFVVCLFIAGACVLGDILAYTIRYAYRRFRNRIARGILHGH